MNIILLLLTFAQTQSAVDKFLDNTAPYLGYLISGSEILPNAKSINFGIEGNYLDYELGHYNTVVHIPTLNGYLAFKSGNFDPYLKLGVYPKTNVTNKTVPFFTVGSNLRPKFSTAVVFHFGYSTLMPLEYLPGDLYYNYHYTQFHTLNLSLIGFKKISSFVPFLVVGLMPSYVAGKFRVAINRTEEDFNRFILGWHIGFGFKLFFVKLNAELVNRRLAASTMINL
ncbi:MAG: hypothetical protein ABIK93_08570 [candidate division WOR-3 bacterium]